MRSNHTMEDINILDEIARLGDTSPTAAHRPYFRTEEEQSFYKHVVDMMYGNATPQRVNALVKKAVKDMRTLRRNDMRICQLMESNNLMRRQMGLPTISKYTA